MPDLEALFGEEGGTILLKASQTNVDASSTTDPKTTLTEFPNYRFDYNGDDQFIVKPETLTSVKKYVILKP